jgi:hypothetical protein
MAATGKGESGEGGEREQAAGRLCRGRLIWATPKRLDGWEWTTGLCFILYKIRKMMANRAGMDIPRPATKRALPLQVPQNPSAVVWCMDEERRR